MQNADFKLKNAKLFSKNLLILKFALYVFQFTMMFSSLVIKKKQKKSLINFKKIPDTNLVKCIAKIHEIPYRQKLVNTITSKNSDSITQFNFFLEEI